MTAAGLIVTDLSHLASDSTAGAISAGRVRFAVSSQPSRPAHDVIAMSRGYQRVALGRRGR